MLRTGHGRIVHIGSIGGRVSSPGLAPYSASKHAIEALAEVAAARVRAIGHADPRRAHRARRSEDRDLGQGRHVGRRRRARARRRRPQALPVAASTSRAASSTRAARRACRPRRSPTRWSTRSRPTSPKARYLVGPDAKLGGPRDHAPPRPRSATRSCAWARRAGRSAGASRALASVPRAHRSAASHADRRVEERQRVGEHLLRERGGIDEAPDAEPLEHRDRDRRERPESGTRAARRRVAYARSSMSIVASRWRRALAASFSRASGLRSRVEHELEVERGPLVVPRSFDHAAHTRELLGQAVGTTGDSASTACISLCFARRADRRTPRGRDRPCS